MCGASAPAPFAPCACPPPDEIKPPTSDDYEAHFARSLALVEAHLLDSLRVAQPGSSTHISACQALLKLAESRHGTYQKHQEALAVESLNEQLETINAHLAGHARDNGLAENADAQESAGGGGK